MIKNNVDKQYFELVNHILKNGVKKSDRTGTGTISVFDYTMRFNMNDGFPLLTSKKMFTKGVIHELIWFLRGDTNIRYLIDNDVHIWDGDAYKNFVTKTKKQYGDDFNVLTKEEFIESIKSDAAFAKEHGELGPVYGRQWRAWSRKKGTNFNSLSIEYIDQIENLISDLKTNPDSRRLMVSAWNVSDLDSMVLPPCHYGFQCYTQEISFYERKKWWCDSIDKSISYAEDLSESELDTLNIPKRKLSLKWTQRSIDVGLGLSFNITSYALLLHLLAKEVNMIPHELIFSGGDCHIYLNHVDKLKEQLKNETFELPKLELTNSSLNDIKYEDIKIVNYKSAGTIKMDLSN